MPAVDNGKERLKLEHDIGAVRLLASEPSDELTGVAVSIPAGEIVYFNRNEPAVERMQQIEWQGSRYEVFADDLLPRTEKHKTSTGAQHA